MTINSQRLLWIAVVILAITAAASAQIRVTVAFGPPALPIYEQPLCPGEGYIWTPGFWAWGNDFDDYYWVPGTWVLAPQPGFLWTPGWWGWGGDGFIFHEGFWGPVVGFYGGINYGFGYYGHGYEGGRWENDHFYYNRAVNNVNVNNIHNVYNTTVINNTTVNRVSYNGGNGGTAAQPTPQEQAAARAKHIPPVAAQSEHVQTARANPQLRASVNQGKPPIAATPKPAAFQGSGVVPAKQSGGPYTPPQNRASNQPKANTQTQAARPQNNVPRPPENNVPRPPENKAEAAQQPKSNSQAAPSRNNQAARPENNVPQPSTAVHPNELPPIPHTSVPNTGNAVSEQKYQQQQEQLRAQQAQERQKLQQRQEQEHQQLAQQQANKARQQQLEQQHQKQTQELQQEHQQQQEQMARQQQQHMQASQPQAHASQSQPPNPKP